MASTVLEYAATDLVEPLRLYPPLPKERSDFDMFANCFVAEIFFSEESPENKEQEWADIQAGNRALDAWRLRHPSQAASLTSDLSK